MSPITVRNRKNPTTSKALDAAFAAFAEAHPLWAASLFDRHLLGRLAEDADDLAALTPEQLADAWTRQFDYWDETARARATSRVAPIAADFLQRLRAELERSAPPVRASRHHGPRPLLALRALRARAAWRGR